MWWACTNWPIAALRGLRNQDHITCLSDREEIYPFLTCKMMIIGSHHVKYPSPLGKFWNLVKNSDVPERSKFQTHLLLPLHCVTCCTRSVTGHQVHWMRARWVENQNALSVKCIVASFQRMTMSDLRRAVDDFNEIVVEKLSKAYDYAFFCFHPL